MRLRDGGLSTVTHRRKFKISKTRRRLKFTLQTANERCYLFSAGFLSLVTCRVIIKGLGKRFNRCREFDDCNPVDTYKVLDA